ncbi:MAG: DUF211 domain-containing protein [Hahellaceae bacterium]|nr:DUF211 domain-containing protein [Hahellaceae bacterium]
MALVTRLVLDVLKPHQPSVVVFSTNLASVDPEYHVCVQVTEVDKQTETTLVTIEGPNVDFDRVKAAIEEMGASIHSIDEVEAVGDLGE